MAENDRPTVLSFISLKIHTFLEPYRFGPFLITLSIKYFSFYP